LGGRCDTQIVASCGNGGRSAGCGSSERQPSGRQKHSTVAASAENEKEDQARENAVSAWEDKTRDLYGKGWAYWTKSTNRRVVCQPLVKNSVSCTATANPCFYPMGQD
jgi:hypothetical protein